MDEFRYPRLINVMIASPSRVGAARDTIQGAIEQWNILNAEDKGVVLMPYRWEDRASAEVGEPGAFAGQDLINVRLVDRCHILFAVFHERLGTPTAKFSSGTEEEVERALQVGLKVHLLFSTEPGSISGIDPAQLQSLQDYKKRMYPRGVVKDFDNQRSLHDAIMLALAQDIRDFQQSYREAVAGADGAIVRSTYDVGAQSIVIRNDGSERVDRLIVGRVSVGGVEFPVSNQGIAATLRTGGHSTYHFSTAPAIGTDILVELSWRGESGKVHRSTLRL